MGLTFSGFVHGQDFSQFFVPKAFFNIDFIDHEEVPFAWTLKGKSQAYMNEGLTALREGRYGVAEANFKEVCALDSTFWQAKYYRAVSLKTIGAWKEAKLLLIQLHAKHPGPEVAIELGEIYQLEGDFGEASALYLRAIENKSNSPTGYSSLASLRMSKGDERGARKILDQGIKVVPDAPHLYVAAELANLSKDGKVTEKTLEGLSKALSLDSVFRPALFWRGLARASRGEFQSALTDLNKLVRRAPGNPAPLILRGMVYVHLNRFEDAFTDLRKAVLVGKNPLFSQSPADLLNPNNDFRMASDYFLGSIYGLQEPVLSNAKKGFCLFAAGMLTDARSSLSKALAENPHAGILLLKGVLFEKMELPDSAFACYTAALKENKDLFFAHFKRAIHFYARNDNTNVFYEAKEMKRIDPENEFTYYISGITNSTLGDFAGCAADLQRALRNDSSNLPLVRLRAFCKEKNKDYSGALKDILYYRSKVPDDESTFSLLLSSYLGSGDTLSAVKILQPVSDKAPTNCELMLMLSEYLISAKEYGRAEFLSKLILKKVETGTCDDAAVFVFMYKAQALYLLGLVEHKNGRLENALAKYSESLLYQQPSDVLLRRCLLLIKLDRIGQAKKDLQRLRERSYAPAQPYIDKYLN